MSSQACPKAVGNSSLKEEGKNFYTVHLKKKLWVLSKSVCGLVKACSATLKSSAEHKGFSDVAALKYSITHDTISQTE